MYRKSANLMKLCKFILLLLPSVITAAAQLELFEGSACRLHTGEMGVCKRSDNCKWLIQNLQKKKIKLSDISRCTFAENGADVVCCGDEYPSKPPIPDNREPCKYGYVFDDIDCSSSPSSSEIPVNPVITETKISGTKITEACLRYSSLATVYFPSSIINGRPAGLTEFPHMVALGYPNDKGDYDFDCGASLIADQWAVTAAHCIKDRHMPTIVRMGKIYLLNDEDGVEAIDRPVSRIIKHPDYSFARKKNDIALIEFSGSVEFNDLVRPACIRIDTADIPESQELMIAGWGSIEAERTNRSELLLKANVTSVPLHSCNRTLIDYNRRANQPALRALSQSQMCAVNLQERSDACQGDSGGPLFIYNVSGMSTIVGIISFGVSCGTALPSVYTRIASYMGWIEDIVWP